MQTIVSKSKKMERERENDRDTEEKNWSKMSALDAGRGETKDIGGEKCVLVKGDDWNSSMNNFVTTCLNK